ncbi:hypothetical protein N9J56_01095 [Pelagibacteraceae bacterium]|nr:hypothetical protein [Pelagibacteraceae bacterium]
MIKLRNMLIAAIAIAGLSTSAFAGSIGIGVAGSLAVVEASGTEKDKDGTADTSVRNAEASNNAYIGEFFGEYSFDNGFTLGVSYIPGSADVSSKTVSRTDTSNAEVPVRTTDNVTRKGSAEVSKHLTYYAAIPLGGAGLYGKLGMVTMDVTSNEVKAVGGGYGNTDADGILYGLGFKADLGESMYYKIEGTTTEFDTITINSATADKGNSISADLDVTKLTLAVGYAF